MLQSDYLTYIANAGVLLSIKGKKVIIDGLNNDEYPIYKGISAEIREKLINGIAPYDNIDIMLITHHHSDHFDLESVARFLYKNPETIVISSHEVIETIKDHTSHIVQTRLIGLKPQNQEMIRLHYKGIDIAAFALAHDGKEYGEVCNLAFLIEHGKRILCLGDAAPIAANFEAYNLGEQDIDLLIANFPYISLPTGRSIVSRYVKPKKVAVVHLPNSELDRFGWIKAAKKSYQRVKSDFVEAEFLEDLEASMKI